MNLGHVTFELSEARMHLDEVIRDLREGAIEPNDDMDVQVRLEHVLDHLCFAWSSRDLTPEQLKNLPQSEFERLANTVPDLHGQRVIP